ncbi:MAG: hypothetical protein NVV74_04585 [Magnetospirillum sp.]|nr:hypothetical protein [Magnetospirillum sp.]
MKKLMKALFLTGLVAVVTFALIEVMLRVVPLEIADFDSTISYGYSPDIGYTITPGGSQKYVKRCFAAHSSVNSAGFRDREWDGSPVDAVILGDSFVQASEVEDNRIAARVLENLTGRTFQNIGVQGQGTVSERIMFNRFAAARKPKYVFLFFIDNDISDNYCSLSARFGGQPATPCVTEGGGTAQARP